MKQYRGMEGDLRDEDKRAVDGLIALLADVNKYDIVDTPDKKTDISVVGSMRRVVEVDNPNAIPFCLWSVCEVAFTQRTPQMTGGSSIMTQANTLGLLRACEDYLTEFYTLPYRPDGWESNIDEKAEAEDRLRDVWKEDMSDGEG